MSHPAGERLRCDHCGAQILFEQACPCPEREPKQHEDMCCGVPMRSLGVGAVASQAHGAAPPPSAAGHP